METPTLSSNSTIYILYGYTKRDSVPGHESHLYFAGLYLLLPLIRHALYWQAHAQRSQYETIVHFV